MKRGPSGHLKAIDDIFRKATSQPPVADGTKEERFAGRRAAMDQLQPVSDESVSVTPLEVAGCKAEWIVAPNADEASRVLMIHGGGFTQCGLNSHRNTSIELSKASNCAVLAIDYRLSPEAVFPAALDDCMGAWDYMISNGPSGTGEATNAFVMGDSAGGNLAAVVTLRLRDEGGRQADAAILMSPWLDLTSSGESWISNNSSDAMLHDPEMAADGTPGPNGLDAKGSYLADADPEQPYASPIFADLAGLPPFLIMAGSGERLRDDAVRFHEKAVAAGVFSRLELWDHVYHAWTSMAVTVPEAAEGIRRMGQFLNMECYKKVATARFAEFKDLSDAMAENAARWPDHPAVVDGGKRLTWAEFDARLNQMANALIARGIKPNDKVAALARNSLDYMVVMFGTLRAGACTVPLSGMASSDALAMMIENSDSKIFFLEGQYRDLIDPVKDKLTGVIAEGFVGFDFGGPEDKDGWQTIESFIEGYPTTNPGIAITPDMGFNIIYSSGTTGVPKGILHARKYRFGEFPAGASTGYSPYARTLVSTPLYSNTTMAALLPTMANGGCAVIMAKFNTVEFLELAEENQITHAMLVPVQYQRILEHEDFDKYDLSTFLMKYSTSAPLREDLKRRVITDWAGGLIEYYGMTEGGVGCILIAHMFPHKLHTVGFPFPGAQFRIVGEDGKEVGPGQPGELYGRSGNMMEGYFKAKDKTDEASWYDDEGNRWQRSGDMGRMDEDGFVELLDRKKDMIISGGFNVFAADLEDVLIKHDEVGDVAVIAVPSDQWGETPLAIVEPAPGTSPDPEALLKWANDQLGKGQRISKVDLMDDLPRSTIGKVLKKDLREPYWAHLEKRVG